MIIQNYILSDKPFAVYCNATASGHSGSPRFSIVKICQLLVAFLLLQLGVAVNAQPTNPCPETGNPPADMCNPTWNSESCSYESGGTYYDLCGNSSCDPGVEGTYSYYTACGTGSCEPEDQGTYPFYDPCTFQGSCTEVEYPFTDGCGNGVCNIEQAFSYPLTDQCGQGVCTEEEANAPKPFVDVCGTPSCVEPPPGLVCCDGTPMTQAMCCLATGNAPTGNDGSVCIDGTHNVGASGGTGPYTYSSSSTNVATVDSSGEVTGVSLGTTSISITDSKGCIGVAIITVTGPTGTGGNICLGSTLSINATGGQGPYTYVSENPEVATVDAAGVVTGVAIGSAAITITDSTGCPGGVSISVGMPTAEGGALCVGSNLNVNAAGGVGPYTYTSSNTNVAAVESSGEVTGLTAGTATITITDSNQCSVDVQVTVRAVPSASGGSLCVGGTLTVAPSGGAAPYQFTSSNTNVATVDANGLVTAVSTGSTSIAFTDANGCGSAATVTVSQVSGSSGSICVGSTHSVNANGCFGPYSYSSSDSDIASVDESTGVVTGHATGSVTITITDTNQNQGYATVTVNAPPAAAGGTVCVLGLLDLNPQGGVAPYSYSSSNNLVATAAAGYATGVSAGSAIITITDMAGCKVEVSVTVAPIPTLSITSPISGSTFVTGETITLQAGASPFGGTYTWVGVTSVDSSDPSRAYVNYSSPGTKVVSVAYQSAAGCLAIPSAITLNIVQAPLAGTIEWVSQYPDNPVENYQVPDYSAYTSKPLGWLSGLRYFPDGANQEATSYRSRINVKIRCPGFGGKTIYLRAFDVDDPTSPEWDPTISREIDTNDSSSMAGDDNRGGTIATYFFGKFVQGWTSAISVQLDGNGEALVEFNTSSFPGDNFRIAATLADHVSELTALQVSSSDAANYVSSSSSEPAFSGIISSTLTVWRKLHVEIDSMAEVPQDEESNERNYVTGNIAGQQVIMGGLVHLNLNNALTEFQRYSEQGARIEIEGVGELRVFDGIDEDTISVFFPDPSLIVDMIGKSYKLYDDDHDVEPLPMRSLVSNLLQRLQAYYAPAYIKIEEAVNPETAVRFVLNHDVPYFTWGIPNAEVFEDVAWNDKENNEGSSFYWHHLVTLGYQPTLDKDWDKDIVIYMGATLKDGAFGRYSAIFTEPIREFGVPFNPAETIEVKKNKFVNWLSITVAHEIGHAPGDKSEVGDHAEAGIMAAGGASGLTANFSNKTIVRFRGVSKWHQD